MEIEIKKVMTNSEAESVITFLLDENTFATKLTSGEVEMIRRNVFSSINTDSSKYFYAKNGIGIVGAIGIMENEYKTEGFKLDYFAVKKEFQRNGIGSKLLWEAEIFAREMRARYITIDTEDIESFAPSRKFYQKHGYTKTGHVPEFYDPGEGRIDYQKIF